MIVEQKLFKTVRVPDRQRDSERPGSYEYPLNANDFVDCGHHIEVSLVFFDITPRLSGGVFAVRWCRLFNDFSFAQ